MKWLLISNVSNPGDEWARFGVVRIIKHLDDKAELVVLERDYRKGNESCNLTEPKGGCEFDFSVLCGMPLIWHHKEQNGTWSSTIQHESWKAISGWLSADKRMIVAGFGIFCPYASGAAVITRRVTDMAKVVHDKLLSKCAFYYSRSPLASTMIKDCKTYPCPSVFASVDIPDQKDLMLCTLMTGAGHYPELSQRLGTAWDRRLQGISGALRQAGYTAVAHNMKERKVLRQLGWPESRSIYHDGNSQKLLEYYARCKKYVGNRIHGAIVSRSMGADTTVIAIDSRLKDVSLVGGKAFTPDRLPPVNDIISRFDPSPFDREAAFATQVRVWKNALRI